MPITVTFDIPGSGAHDLGRLQSMFERLNWQRLGSTTYRYPRLSAPGPEDWLNHVIPALMLLRTSVLGSRRSLTKFTLDATTSTGVDADAGYGKQPENSLTILNREPSNDKFGESNLLRWLESVEYPYAPGSRYKVNRSS